MTITLTNPEALPKVDFHRQVAIATGSKLVFMARQVAWDADGTLVGKDDLAAQVEQCDVNLAAAVEEAGGTFDDVAKLTTYITGWTLDKMPLVQEDRARALATIGVATPCRFQSGSVRSSSNSRKPTLGTVVANPTMRSSCMMATRTRPSASEAGGKIRASQRANGLLDASQRADGGNVALGGAPLQAGHAG